MVESTVETSRLTSHPDQTHFHNVLDLRLRHFLDQYTEPFRHHRTEIPLVFKKVFTESEVTESAIFGFDLGRERENIFKYGEAYWEQFKENVSKYANEAYGKVRTDYYYHDIVRIKGRYRIGFFKGNGWVDAAANYNQSAADQTKPGWYRNRNSRDVFWAEEINDYLNHDPNLILVDLSPAPFEIPLEERKAEQYHEHSFVRVHHVIEEKGRLRLKTAVLRNYLALEEQVQLFEDLSGQVVSGERLLGTVGKLREEVTLPNLWGQIQSLYENTSQDRKIPIPEEDNWQKSAEEMVENIAILENWLKGIFLLMGDRSISEDIITEQFHGFEMAVKTIIKDGQVDVEFFQKMNPADLLKIQTRQVPSLVEHTKEDYQPGKIDCPGKGAGFGRVGWTTETKKANGEKCVEICCRRCGWKPDNQQVERINKGLIIRCPTCGWKPGESV